MPRGAQGLMQTTFKAYYIVSISMMHGMHELY